MRTLEINKVDMWYVEPLGTTDVVDDDGFSTGELERTFSEPTKIRIPLYPASGKITNEAFGNHAVIDMITTTSDKLPKSALLFESEPEGDYENTYSYRIDEVSESLNINRYGLTGR